MDIFFQVDKEMSNNSADDNPEDPMPQDDGKDKEGIVCIACVNKRY